MGTIEILLKPSYNKTISELGYGENDDYNEDNVLFQQGYNSEILEVTPSEEFTISENYEYGYLENFEDEYTLILNQENEDWEDENEEWEEENRNSESIIFYPGDYVLNDDGVTFQKI